MTDRGLIVEHGDGRLSVTINRPEKRNALSRAVLADLKQTFVEAAQDETLRVAVLSGSGEISFAAGGDLKDLDAVRTLQQTAEMAEQGKAATEAIRAFPVPVVAALNGDALGGGAELAASCDFRVAAAHARIGFIQGRLNITTAWGGGVDLMQIVGRTTALRLLSRCELLAASTARALGLFDAVAGEGQSLDECIDEFIAPILRQTPQVLRGFKALNLGARRGHTRDALLAAETRLFAETWVHDDHWAAADAILAKGS